MFVNSICIEELYWRWFYVSGGHVREYGRWQRWLQK